VLVALTSLRRLALLLIEVDSDTVVLARHLLAGPVCVSKDHRHIKKYSPSKLVPIPHPIVVADLRLDSFRLPDLLEKRALRVVLAIACERNIVLVDNDGGSLDDVEGVKHDGCLLAIRVEVLRALRQRTGNSLLCCV